MQVDAGNTALAGALTAEPGTTWQECCQNSLLIGLLQLYGHCYVRLPVTRNTVLRMLYYEKLGWLRLTNSPFTWMRL